MWVGVEKGGTGIFNSQSRRLFTSSRPYIMTFLINDGWFHGSVDYDINENKKDRYVKIR